MYKKCDDDDNYELRDDQLGENKVKVTKVSWVDVFKLYKNLKKKILAKERISSTKFTGYFLKITIFHKMNPILEGIKIHSFYRISFFSASHQYFTVELMRIWKWSIFQKKLPWNVQLPWISFTKKLPWIVQLPWIGFKQKIKII